MVTAAQNHLTLSGSVSSAATAAQVLQLARAYAPAEKEGQSNIINLLEVAGVQGAAEAPRAVEVRTGFADPDVTCISMNF